MIAKITGILSNISLTEIIVETNGIGYGIVIPLSTYDKLPREGEKISLHTILNIREDAHTLFGFATPEEKALFKLLNTVNGIGPKLSIKILSSISVNSFCEAISSSNIKALSKINGVGPKSAERMVIELKDKVVVISPESSFTGATAYAESKNVEEAVLALVQLGFKYDTAKKSIMKIAHELPTEEHNSENLIRLALHNLNS